MSFNGGLHGTLDPTRVHTKHGEPTRRVVSTSPDPRISATKEHSFAGKPVAASRCAAVFADDRMIDLLDRELDDDPYMCAYLRARFDKYKRVDCVLMRKAYAACNYAGVRAVAFVKPTAARENRRRGRQQMRAIPTLLGVQCASLTLTEVEERGSVGG